jgi:hypothetical protein
MFFLHNLDFADFTFIIIDVGELIVCGETFAVTVCENAQLIFPLCIFRNKTELSIRCDLLKGHLQ